MLLAATGAMLDLQAVLIHFQKLGREVRNLSPLYAHTASKTFQVLPAAALLIWCRVHNKDIRARGGDHFKILALMARLPTLFAAFLAGESRALFQPVAAWGAARRYGC